MGPLTSCVRQWTQDSVLPTCREGSPLHSRKSVQAVPELVFLQGSRKALASRVTAQQALPMAGSRARGAQGSSA